MGGQTESVARGLLTASAVRERANEMLAACEAGELAHWRVDYARFEDVVGFVLANIRRNYPRLDIPFHSRWRHFESDGNDRAAAYKHTAAPAFGSIEARSRAAFDLAVVSVFLDAGAGQRWRYRTSAGVAIGRSEGLAAASIDMFESGFFSARSEDPRRVDAGALLKIDAPALARGLQADDGNPIEALEGRLALLHGLGRTMQARPDVFADADALRPGALFDRLIEGASGGAIAAPDILRTILDAFGAIWPGRIALAGAPLGDVWRHPAIRRDDATNGLVPFHKLSQWLAYSLVEPLRWAGWRIAELDGLTGLAEYRNGGLFVDLELLRPKERDALEQTYLADDIFVVEWRALTVALIDRLAESLRRELGLDARALPLARILQGGTWSAGREIAFLRRADGRPPLAIRSDGALF